MANIRMNGDVNMHNANVWYGTVVAATSNKIVIVNGPLEGVYTGNFAYSSTGVVYGTWTGYDLIIYGSTVLSITGLNVNATYAQQHIQSNDLQPLFQTALAGNDQFAMTPGSHVIDGFGGYNTVYEPGSFLSYNYSSSNGAFVISNAHTLDALYNVGGVYFSDGFFNLRSGTFSTNTPSQGFAAVDMTTGTRVADAPVVYHGPVVGLQKEYISITTHNLNVTTTSDNWFVHTGSGTDAIAVHGGTNVLDGGTSSNFLVGGDGSDTFFVDDRAATAAIWSTVVGFHRDDAATVWGVTPQDFNLSWVDGQGAAGYTGLTLHATAANKPTASLTLTGFSTGDLSNGRLSVAYGNVEGNSYMYVHAN